MIDLSIEFPQLKDQLYLDHAGASLMPVSLLRNWNFEVLENLYGNPHSLSPASEKSTARIERVRARIKGYVY
jgi:molybdenum cofactor sulfurtransferase